MAHQQDAGAVDVPESHSVDSAAAALREMNLTEEPGEVAEEEPEGEIETDETDDFADADLDDDAVDEGDGEESEPETAIDAPASLNADEKKAYAQLPKEAQQFVSQLETRRNTQVQEVTTKAANAQREAQALAANAEVEAKRLYAEQLKVFAANFAPERPDPALAQHNPSAYIAQQAQYDAQAAQYQELMQHVEGIGSEAEKEAEAAFVQHRDQQLMQIPQVANPETRKAYLDRAFTTAEKLGYDPAELSSSVSADEVQKLHAIADAFEKAEKYDKAMSKRMERVRGHKRSSKPGTAQLNSSGNRNFAKANERLRQTGSVDDAAAAFRSIL